MEKFYKEKNAFNAVLKYVPIVLLVSNALKNQLQINGVALSIEN